jgi:hypothetical protein
MIDSTSGIYGEIFRLLAFIIEELDKIQFWVVRSEPKLASAKVESKIHILPIF